MLKVWIESGKLLQQYTLGCQIIYFKTPGIAYAYLLYQNLGDIAPALMMGYTIELYCGLSHFYEAGNLEHRTSLRHLRARYSKIANPLQEISAVKPLGIVLTYKLDRKDAVIEEYREILRLLKDYQLVPNHKDNGYGTPNPSRTMWVGWLNDLAIDTIESKTSGARFFRVAIEKIPGNNGAVQLRIINKRFTA